MAAHNPESCSCNKCVAARAEARVTAAVNRAAQSAAEATGVPVGGASRADVYKAIDSERAYQEMKWGPDAAEGRTPEDHQHSVTEWLTFIQSYVHEGVHIVSRGADPEASRQALNTIRKIAGMAVACMEQNGAPQREGFER